MKLLQYLTINTDASFHPEYKVGGYAFYIICDLFKITKGGQFKKQPETAQEAEIMCIGNALATLLAQKELPVVKTLVINTDCKYGAKAIEKKEGELATKINELLKDAANRMCATYEFRHVKAHRHTRTARHWVNDWCDKEAKKWMRITLKEKYPIKTNS